MADHADDTVKGWVPVKLYGDDESLQCRWLYVGDKDFTEPFFDDTISSRRGLPENGYLQKRMSSIDDLTDRVQELQVIEPTAFIFHISRCGSTLISQLLGIQPSNIILSEVPFFDDLLRFGKKQHCMTRILPHLKAAIGLYGAKRNADHQQLFIKTDSWHIHFYKELRTLYPTVPFFLMYRKPNEVLRSQQKKRGMHVIPNYLEAAIFGFDQEKISTIPFDEYSGMVIESYLDAFVEILQKDRSAYAINYHGGAMQMVETIAAVTNLHIAAKEKDLMKNRAGFHAKFPKQIFSEEIPDEPIPGFLKRSFELYDQIEQARLFSL